jgi:type IV secretory pathway VirB6-like protein
MIPRAGTAMILLLATVLFAIGECFGGGVMAFLGVFLLLARAPLFRLAVTREPDAILCR